MSFVVHPVNDSPSRAARMRTLSVVNFLQTKTGVTVDIDTFSMDLGGSFCFSIGQYVIN